MPFSNEITAGTHAVGPQCYLAAEGIQTGIHYPVPVHLQPAYADLGYGRGAFPQSEKAAAEVLSLPLYPEITDAQLEWVSRVVQEGVHAG